MVGQGGPEAHQEDPACPAPMARPSAGRRPDPSRPARDHQAPPPAPAGRSNRQIQQRNAEVVRNLALAHHVAERYLRASGCRGGASPEDVHAIACAGLVRCLDRYDPSQGVRLSTYAVPYITGAIRQHLRDHWRPLKVPRRLLELQQRAQAVQNRRQKAGLSPLPAEQLAAALDTGLERLREAQRAWELLRVESLDALTAASGDGALGHWLDATEAWQHGADS